MPDQWFRLYNCFRHDRKIRKLSDAEFRAWVTVLSVASEEGGHVPSDIEDIAMELHVPADKARSLIQALVNAKLLDRSRNGYAPHNWALRQFKSDVSTPRVQRFRKRFTKRDETVSVTPPEQRQSRADTEQKEVRARDRAPKLSKNATSLPEAFPDSEALMYAQGYWTQHHRLDLHHDVREQAEAFRDHHTANGKTSKDWRASWRTWCRNALKFNRSKGNGRPNGLNPHDSFLAGIASSLAKREQREDEGDSGNAGEISPALLPS